MTMGIKELRVITKIFFVFIVLLIMPRPVNSQRKIVKVLVSTPHVENKVFQPISDVMSGTIIRELKRAGGMIIFDRDEADRFLEELGQDRQIDERGPALEIGRALGVDIVIYSTITKKYDLFHYSITFLEVEKDVIQRIRNGSFKDTDPPSQIGRIMKEETQKLIKYFPLPSELEDPGALIRENTIMPQYLPQSAEIEDLQAIDRYGHIEQIFNYYRVFPGEIEYRKLENQRLITRLSFREDIDAQLKIVDNLKQMLTLN